MGDAQGAVTPQFPNHETDAAGVTGGMTPLPMQMPGTPIPSAGSLGDGFVTPPIPMPFAHTLQQQKKKEGASKVKKRGALLPGLELKEVGGVQFDGGRVLRFLSLSDVDVLGYVSKPMREWRSAEVLDRLSVFHYNQDLLHCYGFNKPQYSRMGRIKKPVNWVQQITERMCKFLVHYSQFVKELDFREAPCDVLESEAVTDMLARMSVSRAYFPTDGWSSTTSRKRIIQALRKGVEYVFVDHQNRTSTEGVR